MKTCSRSFGSQPRLTRITQIDFSRTDNRPVAPESSRGRTFAKAGSPIHDSRLRLRRAYGSERFTPARLGGRGDRGGIHRCPTSDLRRLTSGFTLIELLVVIIMIAILASLLYPAINGAQRQAKNTQAKNELTQIVSAVNAYYTEYGMYPTSPTTDVTFSANNNALFDVLRNMTGINPGNTSNPRGIVFINVPTAKDQTNPKSGIRTDPSKGTVGVWYDPWGVPYNVRIDGTYDNLIANPYSKNAGSAPNLNGGVIAWSFGPDNQSTSVPGPASDKNIGTSADDVISWQ